MNPLVEIIAIVNDNPKCADVSFKAAEHADVIVGWVKMLLGLLSPEKFLALVSEVAPEFLTAATQAVSLCALGS